MKAFDFARRYWELLARATSLGRIFYQANPTNVYSKVIHANSLPTEKAPFGAAYGFGFDDNLDQIFTDVKGTKRAPTRAGMIPSTG